MRMQVVFERDEEFRRAGIALAAGAAAQLVVDAPAFVALAADDVEPAGLHHRVVRDTDLLADRLGALFPRGFVSDLGELLAELHVDVAAQLNVGAAAGHVGGDRDGAGLAGLGDDIGFLLVIARVQHLVRHLALFQDRRKRLRLVDADRADEHRLIAPAAFEGCA